MKITKHPILDIPEEDLVEFEYIDSKGQCFKIEGQRGKTIAAALHQAGFPVHSHSLKGRNRSLGCGIGKCGACEMMVDGVRRRICITPVDGVKCVEKACLDAGRSRRPTSKQTFSTRVCIIGAGPAGLACREQLDALGIDSIVVDANSQPGGQFNMQTHQFFFFEKEQKYGGMRGFDIAEKLASHTIVPSTPLELHLNSPSTPLLLNTVVWDLLEGGIVAVKNILTNDVSYIHADYLVVATGAIPFMPAFENDDIPGVYTAAVFQKMMNQELTLLGKRVLTIGAGNIGYLTSYQAVQAGAEIRAIIEAADHEGGFPVQANRVRRLGIPIITGHTLVRAIPNEDHTGITGAVIAECRNFQPIPGTEQVIDGIDVINICTGLIPDNQLLVKGRTVFGERCFGAGDAVRIGEGTSAVLRGKQVAYEIAQGMNIRINYEDYLNVSREYIDSQQRPVRLLDKPLLPTPERQAEKPFVQIDCLYGFACNPCTFSCDQGAISKPTTSSVPKVDYDKCIGCMKCVNHCPGLAIFGYNQKQRTVFLPIEYELEEDIDVDLVDNGGTPIAKGHIEKILKKDNKTNVARVKVLSDCVLTEVKGVQKVQKVQEVQEVQEVQGTGIRPLNSPSPYICHCEDVDIDTLLAAIGDRKYISVDEVKHITRIGMGECRGKRCIPRMRQWLKVRGIELTGEATPRAPLANPVTLGDLNTRPFNSPSTPLVRNSSGEINLRSLCELLVSDKPLFVATKDTQSLASQAEAHSVLHAPLNSSSTEVLIAGGGIAGSAAFRYFAEAGKRVVLVNYDRGSSWRCIGGGRPAFSNPDISDIANHNLEIFREIQQQHNIDFKMTRYVNLVHDDATYCALDASRAWSDAYMIDRKDFKAEISPYWDDNNKVYSHALISNDCWQATPGKTIDYIRQIGKNHGGTILEDCELIEVQKAGDHYNAVVRTHDGGYKHYICEHFVNAMGWNAEKFTDMLGIDTQLYPVKHQAFITNRLPNLGKNGDSLDMIIDRRHYKGFSAVYGQQFLHTGQVIGCASPDCDAAEAKQNLKYNSREFLEVVSEVFTEWIPQLASAGIRATWAGYYMEPRYIVDPEVGMLTGLRGHGFMLGQYLAKLYVDKYLGKETPSYMKDLALTGQGLSENAFK